MVYMLLKYRIKEGELETVVKNIKDFLYAVHEQEPDTIRYEVFQEKDKLTFTHVMLFRDQTGQHYHSNTAHFKEFGNNLLQYCVEGPTFSDLIFIGTSENLDWMQSPDRV